MKPDRSLIVTWLVVTSSGCALPLLAADDLPPGGSAGETCDKRWVGTTGGDWDQPTLWDPVGIPGPLDRVCIQSDTPCTVTVAADLEVFVMGLTVDGPGSDAGPTLSVVGRVAVGGQLIVGSGGTLDLAGGLMSAAGLDVLTLGTITGYGTLDADVEHAGTMTACGPEALIVARRYIGSSGARIGGCAAGGAVQFGDGSGSDAVSTMGADLVLEASALRTIEIMANAPVDTLGGAVVIESHAGATVEWNGSLLTRGGDVHIDVLAGSLNGAFGDIDTDTGSVDILVDFLTEPLDLQFDGSVHAAEWSFCVNGNGGDDVVLTLRGDMTIAGSLVIDIENEYRAVVTLGDEPSTVMVVGDRLDIDASGDITGSATITCGSLEFDDTMSGSLTEFQGDVDVEGMTRLSLAGIGSFELAGPTARFAGPVTAFSHSDSTVSQLHMAWTTQCDGGIDFRNGASAAGLRAGLLIPGEMNIAANDIWRCGSLLAAVCLPTDALACEGHPEECAVRTGSALAAYDVVLGGPAGLGRLALVAGRMALEDVTVGGTGEIYIAEHTLLEVSAVEHGNAVVMSSADLVGRGDIYIAPGHTFHIVDGAIVDLSGTDTGSACEDDVEWLGAGTIVIDGALRVSDALIRNTHIQVNAAHLEAGAGIVRNDITLLEPESGGGQLFAEGGSTIGCNHIVSYGDRYLDIDPDPQGDHPTIQDNTIDVIIPQDAGDEGMLLELRTHNFDCAAQGANPLCRSGAIVVSQSLGYSDAWALASLTIEDGARVTLTNRPGYEFDDNPEYPEALYVQRVVLYPDSVLNTAGETLYYQELIRVDTNGDPVEANGSTIIDSPLTTLSLGVITMDDADGYDSRVLTRACSCCGPSCAPQCCPADNCAMITRNDVLGVMEMATGCLDHVVAQGMFGRVAEDAFSVAFDYLFLDDAPGEIVVYATDQPHGEGDRVLLDRISSPGPGDYGAADGPGWARYAGTFFTGDLDLRRRSYIELDVTGPQALVWIDNWSAAVSAPPTLAAVSGFALVDSRTDQPVSGFDPLVDDAVVDIAQVGTQLNIRALTTPEMVGSVTFELAQDGIVLWEHIENTPPYALFGDDDADYHDWPAGGPLPGSTYRITATPHAAAQGLGPDGRGSMIRLAIVQDGCTADANCDDGDRCTEDHCTDGQCVARHILFDLNGDGMTTVVGDVEDLVACLMFTSPNDPVALQDCCTAGNCLCRGDCNRDGLLTITGDLPCWVDCLVFGECHTSI